MSRIGASVANTLIFLYPLLLSGALEAQPVTSPLQLNILGYFEARGLNILVFDNWYDGNFSDAKMSGVEMIHHGVRTATNGDVRLNPTPEQWDPIPTLVDREVDTAMKRIRVSLSYPAYKFSYIVEAQPRDGGIDLSVTVPKPIPRELEGRAGFNLEFLPSAYFQRTYSMDGTRGLFPLAPMGPMTTSAGGITEPLPLATGHRLVLAPEDPSRRVTIESHESALQLFDGRNKAQNGWFVVRSLIPPGNAGKVLEWHLKANTIPYWVRQPVIAHSQVGYCPGQEKIAVLEFDRNDTPGTTARVLEVVDDGENREVFRGELKPWGNYLRYTYATFDFTAVKKPGVYILAYDSLRTSPFRIAEDVYDNAWQPTLDVFLPVQMDHMFVREAYRVWHGEAHRDDARQAPVNHEHFDLYAQGPTTDSPYRPGEHIPGLNVGGWFDAGDFDIRTQTQYDVILQLVHTWESFHVLHDETAIDQERRTVRLHSPDGKADLLQQIEHGTLALIAQQRAVGHAIPGIIDAELSRYTHIGDASTQTDNVVDSSARANGQSGAPAMPAGDDRLAFTSRSTPLNYGSAAALAASGRALRGYADALADECLATARKVWDEEHKHAPIIFRHGNTTGGPPETEELKAAVELLISTRDRHYADRIHALLPLIRSEFSLNGLFAVRVVPYMDSSYSAELEPLVRSYKDSLDRLYKENPYGVPIRIGGWGGAGTVVNFALTNYVFHTVFPKIIDVESVFRGLNYIYGCHPSSDISFVSAVGTHSKRVAYGNNRADFTFIPGGLVPGIVIVKPDFPENKEDWPFLWGENEYVVNAASSYLYLVHAVKDLLKERR